MNNLFHIHSKIILAHVHIKIKKASGLPKASVRWRLPTLPLSQMLTITSGVGRCR